MSKLLAFRLHYSRAQAISKMIQQQQAITPQEYAFYQTVSSDWKKVKRLSVVWIPIIGYPVLLMAAFRPRSFWPEYFWTNKDFIQFTNDMVKDQVHGRESLLKTQSNHPALQLVLQKLEQFNPSQASLTLSPLLQLFNSSELDFNSLNYLHLRMIAYSLSISSLPFYNFVYPSKYLINHLNEAINQIIFDDNLLRNDLNVISQLSDKDILKKCAVRGLLPYTVVSLDEASIQEIKEHMKYEMKMTMNRNQSSTETMQKINKKRVKNQMAYRDQDVSESMEDKTQLAHGNDAKEDKDDEIPEDMILQCGKWNRIDLEDKLREWLLITEKIIQANVQNVNSLISHLVVFGYRRRGEKGQRG